ncbi:mRNA-decapping enzyme subunit 2 [Nowakowskiella sp. JEL0407]|nr:mRNA-decapping enzyme subunit 2 [Nowakowskiella sp. JEL0407]
MSYPAQTLEEVLEDLQSRFIINVPEEELSSVERICFQIEQAHWFYEDFAREQNTRLPSLSLKSFSGKFFAQCPLLKGFASNHEEAFQTFLDYKIRVPVCGAIILNEKMDSALLVRGWKASAGWGFPKGKINRDEGVTSCAIREVLEETGFDITPYLKENEFIERTIKEQTIRLYMIKGVPTDTVFVTKTRKEIGAIQWHKVSELPGWSDNTPIERGRYYMVVPFMPGLRKWVTKYRKAYKRAQKAEQKLKGLAPESAGNVSEYKSGTDWDYKSSTDMDSEHEMAKSTLKQPQFIDAKYLESIVNLSQSSSSKIEQQQSISDIQQQQNLLSLLNSNSQASPAANVPIDPSQAIKSLLGIGTSSQQRSLLSLPASYLPNNPIKQIPPLNGLPMVNIEGSTTSSAHIPQHTYFKPPIMPQMAPVPYPISHNLQIPSDSESSIPRHPLTIVNPVSIPNAKDRTAHRESLLAILKGVPNPPKAVPSSLSRSSTFGNITEDNVGHNNRAAIANLLLSSALSSITKSDDSSQRKMSVASNVSSTYSTTPSTGINLARTSPPVTKRQIAPEITSNGNSNLNPSFSTPTTSLSVVRPPSAASSSHTSRRLSRVSNGSDRSISSPIEQIIGTPRSNAPGEDKQMLMNILLAPKNTSTVNLSLQAPIKNTEVMHHNQVSGTLSIGSDANLRNGTIDLKRMLGIPTTNIEEIPHQMPVNEDRDIDESSLMLKNLLGVNGTVYTQPEEKLRSKASDSEVNGHRNSLIALLKGGQ